MSFTPGSFFKIDALPQDVDLPLDIAATSFNNMSTDIREFLISEGVKVTPSPPTEKIIRETRGSSWSEMRQWKQKRRREQ